MLLAVCYIRLLQEWQLFPIVYFHQPYFSTKACDNGTNSVHYEIECEISPIIECRSEYRYENSFSTLKHFLCVSSSDAMCIEMMLL